MDEPNKNQAPGAPAMDVKPTPPGSSAAASADTPSMIPENEAPAAPAAPAVSIGGTAQPPHPVTGKPEDAPAPTAAAGPATVGKVRKKTSKVLLIIFIALVLAAAAVYFYMKNGKSTTPSTSTNTTSNTTTPATASDVNASITTVDNTVKTSDSTKDTSSSDLTDTTLGL